MKSFSIPEYGRILRDDIPGGALRRLQTLDERQSSTGESTVFDWSRREFIRAKNYVGAVQVPGLAIEILPKIDHETGRLSGTLEPSDPLRVRAQQNLLYMLFFTRKLPISERDLAALRIQKMPLLDALIAVFSEALLRELRLGPDRTYVARQENRPFLKGKLLVQHNLRTNILHPERFYVRFDEFISDNWLNRIFKAACRCLLTLTKLPSIETSLRIALMMLDDVRDYHIEDHHFELVQITRNNERFSPLLEFCRILLAQRTPEPVGGRHQTFSLLFPMERLFEEFVAQFICRHCSELGLSRSRIHVQAVGRRRYMLRQGDAGGRGRFQLIPDIVIDGPDGGSSVIIDTKWKHLATDREDARNGVSQGDLYQLYAYAHRYQCNDSILLYPATEGVSAKRYVVAGDPGKVIRTGFVDLNRDLRAQKQDLVGDLEKTLC